MALENLLCGLQFLFLTTIHKLPLTLIIISFFCKKYKALTKAMVDEQKPRLEVHYPWAAVGINVTRMLAEIMHISDGTYAATKKTWWYGLLVSVCVLLASNLILFCFPPGRPLLESHPNAFNELYCLVFQLFDLTWTQKNGTYMQFSTISEATKQRLNAVLDKQPSTISQFATLLQNECMSLADLWLLSSPSVPAGAVARGKRIVYIDDTRPPA